MVKNIDNRIQNKYFNEAHSYSRGDNYPKNGFQILNLVTPSKNIYLK